MHRYKLRPPLSSPPFLCSSVLTAMLSPLCHVTLRQLSASAIAIVCLVKMNMQQFVGQMASTRDITAENGGCSI
ncbi:hypothetical protein RJT34_22627 [Clitoria ternatea]|uniref:Uncharacterized protein n=1 Tax=Clitoria ternatea TaxID=43366 RepID=A0AAN9IFR4_CLITE